MEEGGWQAQKEAAIDPVDGGSNHAKAFQKYFADADAFVKAPFKSYGKGGSPAITLIARLNAQTGRIEKTTFAV